MRYKTEEQKSRKAEERETRKTQEINPLVLSFFCSPALLSSVLPSRRRRRAGLTIVEMLVSLAIVAMLLVATMLAIDASFKAYSAAVETASTQTATRLVIHRLLTLIRTSTAHGPLMADPASDPPATLSGDTITSPYVELIDPRGNSVRVEYRSKVQQLWVITTPYGSSTTTAEPLLGGVTACSFDLLRREDGAGVLVLERASMDLTVEPDADNTLAIENAHTPPIHIVASTMPRKLQ